MSTMRLVSELMRRCEKDATTDRECRRLVAAFSRAAGEVWRTKDDRVARCVALRRLREKLGADLLALLRSSPLAGPDEPMPDRL